MIAGSDLELIKKLEEDISKRFEMKLLGEAKWLLGMKVDYNQKEGVLELNQEAYLKQVLERCRMSKCKGVDTPMVERMVRGSREKDGFDTMFAHIVGSLMYAAMFTRPDLVQAVQSHIRHLQAVTHEHMKALKRTLRYVRATLSLGLKFGGKNSQGLELYAYSDSDWANDVETRRSTTGYVCMLNGAVVSVGSKLQATVALSSTEAEYMALCAATQDVVYMRRLLEELGVKQKGSTIIFEDNQGCIALAENPVHHQRTKHIDVRYHFIRERVESGEIKIVYVPTSEQVADILTKPLAKVKFEKFRTLMMGH
jgi:Reverse transcriptase (RNA-dependent DNA polymerase)